MATTISRQTFISCAARLFLAFVAVLLLAMAVMPMRADAARQWFDREAQILSVAPSRGTSQSINLPRNANAADYLPATFDLTVTYVEDLEDGFDLTRTETVDVTWQLVSETDAQSTYRMDIVDQYWANGISSYDTAYFRNLVINWYDNPNTLNVTDVAVISSYTDQQTTEITVADGEAKTGKYFRIMPTKTHPYTLFRQQIRYSGQSAQLTLYDADGYELAGVTGTNYPSTITAVLEEGKTYYCKITFNSNYGFTFDALVCDDYVHTPDLAQRTLGQGTNCHDIADFDDVCTYCGEHFATTRGTELHDFDSNGVCTRCGYVAGTNELQYGQTVIAHGYSRWEHTFTFIPEYTHSAYVRVGGGDTELTVKHMLYGGGYEYLHMDSVAVNMQMERSGWGTVLFEAGETYEIDVSFGYSASASYTTVIGQLDLTITPTDYVHSHAADATPIEVVAPDGCGNPGHKTYTCAVCGKTYEEPYVVEHEYVDGVCTVCGKHKNDVEPGVPVHVDIEGAQLGHKGVVLEYTPKYTHLYTFQNTNASPSTYDTAITLFDSNGILSRIGSGYASRGLPSFSRILYAGETYYIVLEGRSATSPTDLSFDFLLDYGTREHVYDPSLPIEVTHQPTCTSVGSGTTTCAACGASFPTSLPMAPHKFGDDDTCTVCGSSVEWRPRIIGDENSAESASTLHVIELDGSITEPTDEVYLGIDVKVVQDSIDANGNVIAEGVQTWSDYYTSLKPWLIPTSLTPGSLYHFTISHRSNAFYPAEFDIELRSGGVPVLLMDPNSKDTVTMDISELDPATGTYNKLRRGYPTVFVDVGIQRRAVELPGTIETVDSLAQGISLNLFDYTILESVDGTYDMGDKRYYGSELSGGINNLTPIYFTGEIVPTSRVMRMGGIWGGYGVNNGFGDPIASQGIVAALADEQGYPVVSAAEGTFPLAPLFDESTVPHVKSAYMGLNHLFTLDDSGNYVYDSNSNYAYYDVTQGNDGDFTVYNKTYPYDSSYVNQYSAATYPDPNKQRFIGFLPFTQYNEYFINNQPAAESIQYGVSYNHQFGISLDADFYVPPSGKVSGEDLAFDFEASDDAWVFIDGVLVADAGGVHDTVSGSINFATGEVKISAATPVNPTVRVEYYGDQGPLPDPVDNALGTRTTIEEAFAAAGKEWDPAAKHHLSFYRLQRNSILSDLSITTNLWQATPQNATTDLAVGKVWSDGAAAHANDAVTVQLLANGEAVEGKTLVLSAATNWAGAFEGLPRFDAQGNEIAYTVSETPATGWFATYGDGVAATEEVERTYWVPVDPADMTSGQTVVMVAQDENSPLAVADTPVGRLLEYADVVYGTTPLEANGTTYEEYLSYAAPEQEWKVTHSGSDFAFARGDERITLVGRDTATGGSYVFSFWTELTSKEGWVGEEGNNYHGLKWQMQADGQGAYLLSLNMKWPSDDKVPQYLTKPSYAPGQVLFATRYDSKAAHFKFYTPVTVTETVETQGTVVTNSNEFGALSVQLEGRGGDATGLTGKAVVTLSDTSISGTYGDVVFENGVAEVTVAVGTPVVATDLPDGIGWTANLTFDTTGWAVQTPSLTGTIAKGEPTPVVFVVLAGDTLVDAVENLIDALPDPDEVTAGDKDAIEDAREAYDALSDEERAQVSQDAKDKLAADEAALDKLLNTPVIERIWGDYANETSAKISAKAFDRSEWVVLARDDDFADALGAVGVAGALDAPIVLTDRTQLSPAAAAEIQRLGATKAYVIGGTGAMKEQLEADLAGIGVTQVDRLWGENSYDTCLACAKEIVALGGKSDEAVIAMSLNFQDALSISPYAYKYKVPVVLQTWGDTSADRGFTPEAAEWLAGRSVLVAGGAGAISDASIAPYTLVDRLWGESGYDTSGKIAEWMTSKGYLGTDAVVFACGAQAPKGTDALAGAALAGRLSAPILLATSNEAMEPADATTVEGFYAANASKVRHTYVLGGAYVMPDALYARIQAMNSAEDVSD